MSDGWSPNAPSVDVPFNNAASNEPAIAPAPDIKTAAELNMREEQRSELVPEPTLTIGGETEKVVHQGIEKQNENRINELRDSLLSARDRMRDDFDRSR